MPFFFILIPKIYLNFTENWKIRTKKALHIGFSDQPQAVLKYLAGRRFSIPVQSRLINKLKIKASNRNRLKYYSGSDSGSANIIFTGSVRVQLQRIITINTWFWFESASTPRIEPRTSCPWAINVSSSFTQ